MNISQLLSRNARKYSEREAIVDGTERITYKQLDGMVNALAHGLRGLGIGRGDRVGLFMPNTKEFISVYFAVLRLGAIIVPINPRLTAAEVAYIADHSGAKALIVHDLLFPVVKDAQLPAETVRMKTGQENDDWLSLDNVAKTAHTEDIICELKDDDEATILYTSGTTGKPKGVLFTYRNIISVAVMICIEMEMNPESRILHMMPLSHSAPLHLFLVSGTYVGATHVVAPTFTPDLLLQLVSREKITHFFGAPVAYLLTAKHPELDQYDLTSMRHWVYGGAPLGAQEINWVRQRLGADNLICVYGLTEAGPNGTLLTAKEHDVKAGSVGRRAAHNCEVRIVDEQGNDTRPGEIGEIVLRGEGTMKGYYHNPDATSETLKNGWLYSGDMAKRDEDGYIWIVDRKKDVIISGGVNIYPNEIEEILRSHPAIADLAVVGVPHEEWGESVKAFIMLKESAEGIDLSQLDRLAAECKRFLEGRLASFKIPRLYEAVADLPRNATGKVLKAELRKRG